MICPACKNQLSQLPAGGLTVDVCQDGCGGIWFDNRELQRVDEAAELDIESFINIRHDLTLEVDFAARRQCPRCPDTITLMRHGYAGNREVQVDACASCGGIWLDAGELAQIRHNSTTAELGGGQKYFRQLVTQQRTRLRPVA